MPRSGPTARRRRPGSLQEHSSRRKAEAPFLRFRSPKRLRREVRKGRPITGTRVTVARIPSIVLLAGRHGMLGEELPHLP
jgi:hypothetical protein